MFSNDNKHQKVNCTANIKLDIDLIDISTDIYCSTIELADTDHVTDKLLMS